METTKYARKPFFVKAVQVTADNMDEVAAWCKGEVLQTVEDEDIEITDYIKVRVKRALSPRQSKAFVGDWVLAAGTGFKVYTEAAFAKSFDRVLKTNDTELDFVAEDPTQDEAEALLAEVLGATVVE